VNEVSAGGRVERVLPTTTDRCPVSGRVVWASLSGDLIHQSRRAGWGLRSGVTNDLATDLIHRSRQAGWGLACCWRDRIRRRPASPLRTETLGCYGGRDRGWSLRSTPGSFLSPLPGWACRDRVGVARGGPGPGTACPQACSPSMSIREKSAGRLGPSKANSPTR
jgi:hypothetical protein